MKDEVSIFASLGALALSVGAGIVGALVKLRTVAFRLDRAEKRLDEVELTAKARNESLIRIEALLEAQGKNVDDKFEAVSTMVKNVHGRCAGIENRVNSITDRNRN